MAQGLKSGPKKNNTKGIAKANKARKRAEAEARQAKYVALSFEEKLKQAGKKVLAKLMRPMLKNLPKKAT